MIYESPLHIFEGRKIDSLDTVGLKKLRQEFMLKFEFNNQTTIRLQDKEYDKAGIIALFEGLRSNGQKHLQVFNNKPLLQFLENGELDFFKNQAAWVDFEDAEFANWVNPYLTTQLSESIFKLSKTIGFGPIRKLEMLTATEFPFSPQTQYVAYSKTFTHFDQWLNDARDLLYDPFLDGDKRGRLKPAVIALFKEGILNILKALPNDIFQPVIAKYANVATKVLTKAFYKSRRFNEFDRGSLTALLQAGRIYLQNDPEDKDIRKIVNDIYSYLHNKGERGEGISTWAVIRIIIILFIFLGRLATCNSSNNSFENSRVTIDQGSQKKYMSQVQNMLVTGTWEADFLFGRDSLPVHWEIQNTLDSRAEFEISLFDEYGNKVCYQSRVATWSRQGDFLDQSIAIKGFIHYRYQDRNHYKNCETDNSDLQNTIENLNKLLDRNSFAARVQLKQPNNVVIESFKIGEFVFKKKERR